MRITEMPVAGAWTVTPHPHGDHRGTFLEWFQDSEFQAATGRALDLAQANCSVSAAGVLRGIHFADVPPGQAKYVTCVRGAVLDAVVDIRLDSPTFGRVETVLLDDAQRRSVFLSEGLGHGFYALTDDATVVYLCSTAYNPPAEHGVHPLSLGVDWAVLGAEAAAEYARQRAAGPGPGDMNVGQQALVSQPILSAKDAAAPTLDEARELGLLPRIGGAAMKAAQA